MTLMEEDPHKGTGGRNCRAHIGCREQGDVLRLPFLARTCSCFCSSREHTNVLLIRWVNVLLRYHGVCSVMEGFMPVPAI